MAKWVLPTMEEDDEGGKCWYLNDKLHREDGPAVECADGYKSWHLNGKRHREDGPAVESAYGNNFWFLNDKKVTEEEHKRMTSKVIEMTMEEMTVAQISKALGK